VEATKGVATLTSDHLIDLAGDFYDFIWNGKEPDGSV